MVRLSKQTRRRSQSPRATRAPSPKTGAKQDKLAKGYKPAVNAVGDELGKAIFVPKIK